MIVDKKIGTDTHHYNHLSQISAASLGMPTTLATTCFIEFVFWCSDVLFVPQQNLAKSLSPPCDYY